MREQRKLKLLINYSRKYLRGSKFHRINKIRDTPKLIPQDVRTVKLGKDTVKLKRGQRKGTVLNVSVRRMDLSVLI